MTSRSARERAGRGSRTVAAVDLGATSGRVMLGRVGPDTLSLTPVARFPNGPVARDDGLHWDYSELRRQTIAGLAAAGRIASLDAIGIDSWAVDYGLIRAGQLTDEPFHYRDQRNHASARSVHAEIPFAELYARGGLQFLPFNTLYQLADDRDAGRLADGDHMLLIPDLMAFELTGVARAEATNASTTGLLRPDGQWDLELAHRLSLPRSLLAPLIRAGETIGPVGGHRAAELGLAAPVTDTPVIAVASHDTASAVAATPMRSLDAAYISCGTWGLVGVEIDRPIMTATSRDANFTNERGAFGTTRFLRNVMGLWLLNESVNAWRAAGDAVDLPQLLSAAADVTTPPTLVDVDDPRFTPPGDMPARIEAYCRDHGLRVPADRPDMVRSIVESLAVAFVRSVHRAAELTARRISVIHIVGGGAQGELLCQAVADRSGLPVVAGPTEATAVGNVLMQGCGLGVLPRDAAVLRELVARAMPPRRFYPSPGSRPDDGDAPGAQDGRGR